MGAPKADIPVHSALIRFSDVSPKPLFLGRRRTPLFTTFAIFSLRELATDNPEASFGADISSHLRREYTLATLIEHPGGISNEITL